MNTNFFFAGNDNFNRFRISSFHPAQLTKYSNWHSWAIKYHEQHCFEMRETSGTFLDQKTKGLKLGFFRDSPLPESVRIYPPSKRSHIPPHKRKPEQKQKQGQLNGVATQNPGDVRFVEAFLSASVSGLFGFGPNVVQRSDWLRVGPDSRSHYLEHESGYTPHYLKSLVKMGVFWWMSRMSHFEWENTGIRWRSFLNGWNTAWGF